ncbi:N-formylglutamate amidohydrolase [Lentisphaera profundi]|uniref:N-formylglutamate amidohydrolase n=1 Tax=Lentisphaera profundi TaxID=1658616 RepID=A0ABY7VW95_9BACT|nr:N-formylglutamate amidohydrolase [Lentisphaera profundi]WDE97529.1 N-formylglutamate amidohydrolase [Lentisphaera profundi]
MILHIPHSSTYIPEEYLIEFLLSPEQLNKEILEMTDHFTDDLFDWKWDRAVFPVSRLLVDVERFEDDAEELMAERGMGVLYERGSQLLPLRHKASPAGREELLNRYYRPHHKKLEKMVDYSLYKRNKALVIDCHSFNAIARSYEGYTGAERPEICLGTDAYHTPQNLVEGFREFFESRGFNVRINDPFPGCLVPMKFYQKDERVQAIMIELRRDLYMNEATGEKTAGYAELNQTLADLEQAIMNSEFAN